MNYCINTSDKRFTWLRVLQSVGVMYIMQD